MFDVSTLSCRIAKDFRPLDDGDGGVEVIGTLNLYERAIKFTYNRTVIYANGMPIIPTNGEPRTSTTAFALTMLASFGDNFILDSDFVYIENE